MMPVFSSKFSVVMSGRFAAIFLSVLVVKSHSPIITIVTSALFVTGFSVRGRLKFLHNIQCMKLATRVCLWKYSVLTILLLLLSLLIIMIIPIIITV